MDLVSLFGNGQPKAGKAYVTLWYACPMGDADTGHKRWSTLVFVLVVGITAFAVLPVWDGLVEGVFEAAKWNQHLIFTSWWLKGPVLGVTWAGGIFFYWENLYGAARHAVSNRPKAGLYVLGATGIAALFLIQWFHGWGSPEVNVIVNTAIGALLIAGISIGLNRLSQKPPSAERVELAETKRKLADAQEALRKAQEPPPAKPQQAQPAAAAKAPAAKPPPPLPDPNKYYDAEAKQTLGQALKVMKEKLTEAEPALAALVYWERPGRRPGMPRDNPEAIVEKLRAVRNTIGFVIVMPRHEDYKEVALELAHVLEPITVYDPLQLVQTLSERVGAIYPFEPRPYQSDTRTTLVSQIISDIVAPAGPAAAKMQGWVSQSLTNINNMRRALEL